MTLLLNTPERNIRMTIAAGQKEKEEDEGCMPKSRIAMQRYAHAVQVNVVQRKVECRYGGKVCCLLSKG
jgi:hypothetical protein